PSAPAPGGTPRPPPEGLSRRSFQTYLFCRSWCASSPKDPVTAKSPAYHGHRLHRILLKPPNTTNLGRRQAQAWWTVLAGWGQDARQPNIAPTDLENSGEGELAAAFLRTAGAGTG